MEYRTTVLLFYLILSRFAFAQANLDSLHAAIVKNDDNKVSVIIDLLEKDIQQMQEEEKCDFLYLKGVYFEQKGNFDKALNCFQISVTIADNLRHYDQSYYDAILRIMMWYKRNDSYFECVKYGLESVNTPTDSQKQYSSMHLIYSTLTGAMLYAGLFADVPKIVEKGLPISREQLKDEDDEYHALRFSEAVAWLLMGDIEKAEETYNKIYREVKGMSTNLKSSLSTLHQEILDAKKDGWDERKIKTKQDLDQTADELLLVDPSTSEGSLLWNNYFSLLRHQLEFFYYDLSNPNDEDLWNYEIANMILRFFIVYDRLPNKESIEYDNILCRKNFLNYHFGSKRKRPISWMDVQAALEENEVAIEVTCIPDEILVIKKNSLQPICISIDSMLVADLERLNINEPLAIDSLYSKNGPLAKIWNLIEQSLKPSERTIYISGSNIFQAINYSAIALYGGGIVSDLYDVHTMLSTSEVMDVKQDKTRRFRTACLLGGVDYNESAKPEMTHAIPFKDEDWNFSPILPITMRSGFHYLPNTLKEVRQTSLMMDSLGIVNTVRTGKDATEEYFKSISDKAPDIIHLATHGFMLAPLFNDNTVQKRKKELGTRYQTILSQSGLLLSGANKKWEQDIKQDGNDGILSSKEIAILNLNNTRLAILTACKSGLGDTTNLTGVPFGVAYAFKMAGVSQILCCLWDVDDTVASKIIKYFYQYLFKTDDARKALELSRKDLIKQGYTSPYYWAPFILVE